MLNPIMCMFLYIFSILKSVKHAHGSYMYLSIHTTTTIGIERKEKCYVTVYTKYKTEER